MQQLRLQRSIALALGLAAAAGTLAAPPAGRLLASQCAQCHGTNGIGPGFDKLAGNSARELGNELLGMKYRALPEGIMDRQAHGYTDDQVQLIANYLAGQRPSGGGTVTSVNQDKPDNKTKEKAKSDSKANSNNKQRD